MEIKEAVEISKTYGLLTEPKLVGDYETPTITVDILLDSYESIMVIEEALNNGYTLCKVDEAIKKIEELFNSTDNRDFRLAFHHAIKIIKEACE